VGKVSDLTLTLCSMPAMIHVIIVHLSHFLTAHFILSYCSLNCNFVKVIGSATLIYAYTGTTGVSKQQIYRVGEKTKLHPLLFLIKLRYNVCQ